MKVNRVVRVPLLIVLVLSGLLTILAGCGGASSGGNQGSGDGNYPGGKPVKLVAPAEPGSGVDVTARAMAEVLQGQALINHPLPVENHPGATGAVWLSQMVNQHRGADDITTVGGLYLTSNELRGSSEYGPDDVTNIARLISEYYMVVVPDDSEFKSLDDLLNAVKEDPGAMPFGATDDDQLPFALLVDAAGGNPKDINYISYDGGGEQIAAMLNGDVKAAMSGVSEFRGQLEAGDLRGLAVIRDERLAPPLDDIPTAKELGYEVDLVNWRGVYGPPGMSEEATNYWRSTLEKMTKTDGWKETAAKNQWETTYLTGKELDRFVEDTNDSMRKALERTGQLGDE